jgi:membrane-associated phospholipid phosphatase
MRAAWMTIAALVAMVCERGARADDRVQDVTWLEASTFLGVGATALALDLTSPGGDAPRWTGPILFDDAARDALAATSDDGRARVARASDIAVGLLVARPFASALVSTLWGKIDPHLAFELAITDLEAYSVTEALTFASKRAFARQRPDAQEAGCDAANATASTATATACARSDRNSSFWSGHTSQAFTAAGLACTEHLRLELYGAPWDGFMCVGTIIAATTIGGLRIVADRHWASDVMMGAAIGGLSGWLTPTWLRFRSRGKSREVAVVPTVAPVQGGVALGVAAVGW